MAEVTVFVDTAVFGALPPLCVKEGTPTGDHLTLCSDVSAATGLGAAWLLVLFGPIGWLLLIVIALTRESSEALAVRLPFSEVAYQRYRGARRMKYSWLVGASPWRSWPSSRTGRFTPWACSRGLFSESARSARSSQDWSSGDGRTR